VKKNILNLLIVAISVVYILILVIHEGINSFLKQIYELNPLWILMAIVFMFLYWFMEALTLNVITRFHGAKKSIKESFVVTMVGQFFNSITPFATGGQPAQALYLIKGGIDTANATSIVMLKFFVFQTVLTVYSLVVIIISFAYFKPKIPFLLTLTVLGLSVHASMIILTILFSYNRTLTDKILRFSFMVLKKIRFIKIQESTENKVKDSLRNFHDNAYILKNNLGLLFETSLIVFLQLTFYFLISFCVYRSFGLSGATLFQLFSAAVYVSTVISIVPLPGAIGGAEIGYNSFFGSFFGGSPVVSALLIWRIITYYSCIGFGSLFSVSFSKKKKRVLKTS
jgi:glycosyltransferase 2 family protein